MAAKDNAPAETVAGGAGNDTVAGGAGNDTLSGAPASAAPIQGLGMGDAPTAAEVGTSIIGGVPESLREKGGVRVKVKGPMMIFPTGDDFFDKNGLARPGYPLTAGVNENVPKWVADNWLVKANTAED